MSEFKYVMFLLLNYFVKLYTVTLNSVILRKFTQHIDVHFSSISNTDIIFIIKLNI